MSRRNNLILIKRQLVSAAILTTLDYSSSLESRADSLDTINFSFLTTRLYDNNLFRRPSGEVSDQAMINKFGVDFSKPIGLQRFHANFGITDSKYDKSDFLDFTAKQYSVGWNWALTPSLTGKLESSQEERLNDFRFVTTPVRNVVKIKTHHFEADFSPHKIAHLLAGFTVLETENDNAFAFDQQEDISNKTNRINVGAQYDFATAYVRAMYRKGRGSQGNGVTDFTRWVDRSSESDSYELTFETTSDTRLYYKLHLGYIDKKFPTFSMRDYSGFVGDVSATYEFTSKLSANASVGRTLRNFIRADSSYAEIDSAKIGLHYSIMPKLSFNANASYLTRDFLGRGPAGNGGRVDKETSFGTSLSWKPRDFVNASVSLNKSNRESTDNFFDYNDTSAFINVGLVF